MKSSSEDRYKEEAEEDGDLILTDDIIREELEDHYFEGEDGFNIQGIPEPGTIDFEEMKKIVNSWTKGEFEESLFSPSELTKITTKEGLVSDNSIFIYNTQTSATGLPFSITVDSQTLEDNTVSIRKVGTGTGDQKRVPIDSISKEIGVNHFLFDGQEILFEDRIVGIIEEYYQDFYDNMWKEAESWLYEEGYEWGSEDPD
jgi:hypothetical protein